MLAVLSPGTWTDLRCAMLALLAVVLPVKLATCQPNDVAASGSAVSADIIAAAKDSCRDVRNSIRLSPDRSILCFDGSIRADLDVGIFRDLRQGGLFVMRSDGGWGHIAIAFSKILRDKDATVILHGHCLSACAEYVLIATSRTIVTKGTIVAWHEVVTQDDRPLHSTCEKHVAAWLDLHRETYDELIGTPSVEALCDAMETPPVLFLDRPVNDRRTRGPQTPHLRKLWRLALGQQGDVRRLFWTWHPKNQGEHFKSRIVYEGYPSEDEVQKFFRSYPSSRVFYDPDPDE